MAKADADILEERVKEERQRILASMGAQFEDREKVLEEREKALEEREKGAGIDSDEARSDAERLIHLRTSVTEHEAELRRVKADLESERRAREVAEAVLEDPALVHDQAVEIERLQTELVRFQQEFEKREESGEAAPTAEAAEEFQKRLDELDGQAAIQEIELLELRARLESTVDREVLELRELELAAQIEELETGLAEAVKAAEATEPSQPSARESELEARVAELEGELRSAPKAKVGAREKELQKRIDELQKQVDSAPDVDVFKEKIRELEARPATGSGSGRSDAGVNQHVKELKTALSEARDQVKRLEKEAKELRTLAGEADGLRDAAEGSEQTTLELEAAREALAEAERKIVELEQAQEDEGLEAAEARLTELELELEQAQAESEKLDPVLAQLEAVRTELAEAVPGSVRASELDELLTAANEQLAELRAELADLKTDADRAGDLDERLSAQVARAEAAEAELAELRPNAEKVRDRDRR